MPADGQEVAGQSAARPVPQINLQRDTANTEFGTDQRVGKMQGRKVVVVGCQVFRPGLIEADHDRRARGRLMDRFDGGHREPQALLFGKPQCAIDVQTSGTDPDINRVTTILQDIPNVAADGVFKRVVLPFPAINPFGK